MLTEQPWLDNKNWADNAIASDARRGHWVIWGFAVFWNLTTVPLLLQFDGIWEKTQREPVTAIAFLFPLAGIALVALAVRATLQWRRFGRTPLVMDPFPGSLGGQVGGRIDTAIPYDDHVNFKVSLSCIDSSVTGTGKNRSRSESVVWHSEGVCHSNRGGGGTALQFRFDVPADLPGSEPYSGRYHLWRLEVHAQLPGTDFERRFEIPVYATGGVRSHIAEGTETHVATIDTAMAGVESVADITPIPGGIQARFPALQRPGQGIFLALFGLVFGGIGIGVGLGGDAGVMIPLVFGSIGALSLAAGIYYLGKSLLVAVTEEGIRSRRFLFGYPLTTRRLPAAEFRRIEIKQAATMTSGNKSTVFYQLYAHGSESQSVPVAERLTSRPEAELVRDTYLTYLGRGQGRLE